MLELALWKFKIDELNPLQKKEEQKVGATDIDTAAESTVVHIECTALS
jgi:hypothetical protein